MFCSVQKFLVMCRRFIVLLLLCLPFASSYAESVSEWFQTTTTHLESVWDKGGNELYIPAYTYHMPYAYSQDKINQYTEYPMGIGFGKGLINESGNWEGIMEWLSKTLMGFISTWSVMDGYPCGASAIAPTGSMALEQLSSSCHARTSWTTSLSPGCYPLPLSATKISVFQTAYVPGGQNVGNVLFTWAKYNLP